MFRKLFDVSQKTLTLDSRKHQLISAGLHLADGEMERGREGERERGREGERERGKEGKKRVRKMQMIMIDKIN